MEKTFVSLQISNTNNALYLCDFQQDGQWCHIIDGIFGTLSSAPICSIFHLLSQSLMNHSLVYLRI